MSEEPSPQSSDPKPRKSRLPAWWPKVRGSSLFRLALVVLGLVIFRLTYDANALRWPLRILIIIAAIWLIPAAIRDTRFLTEWFATRVPRWWHAICRFFRRHSRIMDFLEIILCVILLFFSTQVLTKIYGAMLTSSLRQDEIDAIDQYTSKTVFEAATIYNLAKNHLFFSVINTLTPGGDSTHPVRARFWPFVAVSFLLFGSLVFFAARGQYLEGALLFSLLAINQPFLETALEARGYGLVAMFAAIGALCALRYLESRRKEWLLAFSVTTLLGTWTLPFYILFGGALQLLLFVLRPCKRTFLYGAWTLLAILLVHALVLPQMFAVATGYQDKYGLKYVGLNKVFDSLYFLLPGYDFPIDEKHLIGFILVLILSPLLLRRRYSPTATMAQVTFVLGFGFYLYCLFDGTPPMRVVSWVAAPLGVCLALVCALYLRHRTLIPLRLPLVALIIFVTTPWAQSRLENFDFLAKQKWIEAGRVIHAIAPPGSTIWTPNDYRSQVRAYVDEDLYEIKVTVPNFEEFAGGDGLIFDSLFKPRDQERRIDIDALPPGARFVTFPLRKNYHRLFFVPPPDDADGIGEVVLGSSGIPPFPDEPQPFDPLTLAISAGYGEEMLDEDEEDFLQSASAQAFLDEETRELQPDPLEVEKHDPPPVSSYDGPGLELPTAVTIVLDDSAGQDIRNVVALFTQTLADKTVSARVIGEDGREKPLGEKDLTIEGELVIVPLEDLEDPQKVILTFSVPQLSPLQKRFYPEFEDQPRPPFTLVETWATPAVSAD